MSFGKLSSMTLVMCLSLLPAAAQHHNQHDERALAEDPATATGQIAPVLEGLGPIHMKVSTNNVQAQKFFDQGLALTYGFNHQEALRSFKEAARLDPDLAMAYWGWALVLGPNLNLPMRPEVVGQAYEAVQMAVERRENGSEKEKMLIDALAQRYVPDLDADRGALNQAYFDAMSEVYDKYPDDPHVATLYGAAIMNLTPWDYWERDGTPKKHTEELLMVLERAYQEHPKHTGALHYFIHAIESVDAERGEQAADLLRGVAPGAGHLEHMPSHIYLQLGRYAEGYESNVRATEADEGYLTACRKQGMYPLTYYPHNIHFMAWAAIMQGREGAAVEASEKVADQVPHDMHGDDWGLFQTFLSMPLYTKVRFGMWDEIRATPQPAEDKRYWRGIWHYAQGLAEVHDGSPGRAKKHLSALAFLQEDAESASTAVGFSNAARLLEIARLVLEGELAARRGKFDDAVTALDRAVRLEDSLLYNEPPDWYYPVRHTLGAVLIEAGRADEAEVVFWQDLKKLPNNGYSLRGLARALEAQGRSDEAADAMVRYREAWADADHELTSSRF